MTKKPTSWWRDGVFHIEVPLGIINIRPHLRNSEDQAVVSIELLPDEHVEVSPPEAKGNIRLILKRGETDGS